MQKACIGLQIRMLVQVRLGGCNALENLLRKIPQKRGGQKPSVEARMRWAVAQHDWIGLAICPSPALENRRRLGRQSLSGNTP